MTARRGRAYSVAPLLAPEPPKSKGGRPQVPDRSALTGNIFVRKSDRCWEQLPPELGYTISPNEGSIIPLDAQTPTEELPVYVFCVP